MDSALRRGLRRMCFAVCAVLMVAGFLIGTSRGAGSAATVNPRAASATATSTSIAVDGTGSGRTFDGVGAISGGGGNSRLLINYPEPERSRILDYLFKPGYGANVQLLKIEIGGDANSTDGAEPSVEHTRGAVNCNVGYEFWLAKQAKLRNPRIRLYGLAWAAPGWLDGGSYNYWSTDTINYLLTWLGCAKQHGLTINYLGGRNEEGYDKAWYEQLHSALASHGYGHTKVVADDSADWSVADAMVSDPAFESAVDIVGVHYPCGYLSAATTCNSTANAIATGKPLWASENGGQDINSGAPALIRSIIRGYVDGRMTAYINWPLVAAITPNLPFSTVGLAVAPSPWSGYYRLGAETWAMAQVSQFAQPGWQFIDSASGYLGGDRTNGSYVTLKSPDGKDYSTVIETTTATAPQTVSVNVSGGLSTGTVHVWSTDLNSAAGYFARQPDITPSGGSYSLTLQPGYIYSLTTTTGQGKGTAASPPQYPMALPYTDNFNEYPANTEARYVADMQGAFETRPCLDGRSGQCLQQMAPVKPIEWRYEADSDAYALAGDTTWSNYKVSLGVNMQQSGTAELIGRASTQSRPQTTQAGYYLRVSDNGTWTLAKKNTSAIFTTLASGTTTAPGLDTWHTLALDFQGTTITAEIDGRTLATVQDSSYASGQIGFGVAGYQTDQFDNLSVTPNAATTASGPAYELVNRATKGVIGVVGDSTASGAALDEAPPSGSRSQQWYIAADGADPGKLVLVNAASGMAMAEEARPPMAAAVEQAPATMSANEAWNVQAVPGGYRTITDGQGGAVAAASGPPASGRPLVIRPAQAQGLQPSEEWQILPAAQPSFAARAR